MNLIASSNYLKNSKDKVYKDNIFDQFISFYSFSKRLNQLKITIHKGSLRIADPVSKIPK